MNLLYFFIWPNFPIVSVAPIIHLFTTYLEYDCVHLYMCKWKLEGKQTSLSITSEMSNLIFKKEIQKALLLLLDFYVGFGDQIQALILA